MRLTRSAADAADTPQTVNPRRRGLGPFSGGQLTIIIVTFAVLLLFPLGAWAVSGSNVFVTDAVSGKQAGVNTSGQLATNDNAATVVIGSGTVSVPANGSGVLFLTASVTAYKDVRIIVGQTGAQANRQVVSLFARAGSIQATLDSWTMAAGAETREYQTPGSTLTGLVFNTDTTNTAAYTWTLVGRAN